MANSPSSRYLLRFDLRDPQLRKTLPVAPGSSIIFATVLLKHRDGSGAPLADDLRCHVRTGDDRLTDDQSLVSVEQPNAIDLHSVSDIARK
jgi:hypothetical protein